MKKLYIIVLLIILGVFNCKAIDLYLTNPSVNPTSIPVGFTFTATCTANSTGGNPAEAPYMYYYLSTDRFLSGGDVFIGSCTLPRSSYPQVCHKNLTVPCSTTVGNYYIIFFVDATDIISETNENNNTTYTAITITATMPDLIVQNQSASPTSIPNGSSTSVSCRISNIGCSTAGASSLKVYLSSDNSWDGSDTYLFPTTAVSSISGSSYIDKSNINLCLPYLSGSFPQTKYLIFKADADGAVTEYSETNNTAYIQVTINQAQQNLPDLYVDSKSIYVDPGCASGSNTGLDNLYCVNQLYCEGDGSFTARIYNYTNYDATDVDVYKYKFNSGTGQWDYLSTQTIDVDAGDFEYVGYGEYIDYPSTGVIIKFVVDPNNDIAENNEYNNIGIMWLTSNFLKINPYAIENTLAEISNVSVYPVPTDALLNIVSNSLIYNIKVYNPVGQLIDTYSPNTDLFEFSTTAYDEGIYIISIETENGVEIKKVSIQH
jgi:hypothetical protein